MWLLLQCKTAVYTSSWPCCATLASNVCNNNSSLQWYDEINILLNRFNSCICNSCSWYVLCDALMRAAVLQQALSQSVRAILVLLTIIYVSAELQCIRSFALLVVALCNPPALVAASGSHNAAAALTKLLSYWCLHTEHRVSYTLAIHTSFMHQLYADTYRIVCDCLDTSTLQDKPGAVGKMSVIGLFAAIFAGCYLLPDEHKHLVPLCNIPLIVLSRVPQIITNARNGHTGQVSYHCCT
jgi:PQ loop repeat